MADKKEGLVQKFEVTKLSNPNKKVDAIVLEFDDPIARQGIHAWAEAMMEAGYYRCAAETFAKLLRLEGDVMP